MVKNTKKTRHSPLFKVCCRKKVLPDKFRIFRRGPEVLKVAAKWSKGVKINTCLVVLSLIWESLTRPFVTSQRADS